MTKLYEVTLGMKHLQALVDNGEVPESEIKDTLELMSGDFQEKAIDIVKVVKNQKPIIDAIDSEISRLQAIKKTTLKKAESLKSYLRENMESSGISKIDCPLFSVVLKKPSPTVLITDESLIPDEFINIKTSISPNKKAILEALKGGEEIQGAELSAAKSPLQIK